MEPFVAKCLRDARKAGDNDALLLVLARLQATAHVGSAHDLRDSGLGQEVRKLSLQRGLCQEVRDHSSYLLEKWKKHFNIAQKRSASEANSADPCDAATTPRNNIGQPPSPSTPPPRPRGDAAPSPEARLPYIEWVPYDPYVPLAITSSMAGKGIWKRTFYDACLLNSVVNMWLREFFPGVEVPPGLKVTAGKDGRELDLNMRLRECSSHLPQACGSPHLKMHISWPAGASLDAKGFNGEWNTDRETWSPGARAIIQGRRLWWNSDAMTDIQLVSSKEISIVHGGQPLTAELHGSGRHLWIKWSNKTKWFKNGALQAADADEQRKAMFASIAEREKDNPGQQTRRNRSRSR